MKALHILTPVKDSIELTIEIENTDKLNNVLKNLRKVDSVYEVKRKK